MLSELISIRKVGPIILLLWATANIAMVGNDNDVERILPLAITVLKPG